MSTHKDVLAFPKDFLWGAATSSHQVEGGNDKNDWWEWEKRVQPKEKRSGDACDQFHRYTEDAELLSELGHNAHRLSIEWSRIEPEEGKFDETAIAHYQDVLKTLKAKGVSVMLTLHHFTNPTWFAKSGGWESPSSIRRFERFVSFVVPRLGKFVDLWCTINEPGVYAFMSFSAGAWPPQKKSNVSLMRVMWHLAQAHRRAYRVIHRHFPSARVGIAQNVASFDTIHHHRLREHLSVWLLDSFANHAFYRLTGKSTHDYIGLNYYFNRYVGLEGKKFFPNVLDIATTKKEVSDLGWEIYPEGIFDVIMDFSDWHLPIYITENGVATTDESRRIRFLVSYLKEIYHAIQAGANVQGYFHWSLLDNFEWADGFTPRFGLVEVDYATQERRPRQAAHLYREIIRQNGIPHEYLKYLGHGISFTE